MQMPDLTGTRYAIVRYLARGGMGSVWLVEDTVLNAGSRSKCSTWSVRPTICRRVFYRRRVRSQAWNTPASFPCMTPAHWPTAALFTA